VCVVLIPKTRTSFQVPKLVRSEFVLNDTKFITTCSFTIHFKKISVCTKVLVELYANTCLSVNYAKTNSACTSTNIVAMNSISMKSANNHSYIFWLH
jgi:putative Ca2+/H+ antiporter (TMEM165/GDT1 family)